MALVGNRYKVISLDGGETYQLSDLLKDPSEATDIAASKPPTVREMRAHLETWLDSTARSARDSSKKRKHD